MSWDPGSWSWSMTTVQITGSAVSGPFNAVTVGGEATVEGEESQKEDAFGAPGIVFRPRAPETIQGEDGQQHNVGAEAIAARMGDRLTPFTWRDLRLNKVFPAPKPGTIAMVGYGGAFLAFDDAGEDNRVTLYVPYAKSGETATKCHTIVLDPEQEAIGIVHGDGLAIVLETSAITMRADGSTSLVLAPGTFQATADNISLNGNVAAGGVAAFPVVNATALAAVLTALISTLTSSPATPVTNGTLAGFLGTILTAITPGTGPAATQHFAAL